MGVSECPKCKARVQPTDTLCMDCGADLLAEQRRAEQMLIETARLPAAAAAPPRAAAAMGRTEVGETSEETRLRVFDKQLAQALVTERLTAWVTAAIALIALIALAAIASSSIRAVGGFSGLKAVTPSGIRHLGWSIFTDNATIGAWSALAAIAAFMCLVGQSSRAIYAGKCIRAVQAGEKPVLVGISIYSQMGLGLFSAICAPAGIILGLILKLRPDEETAAFGGVLIWIGFFALLAIVVNFAWGLAEGLKAKARPERTVPPATSLLPYPYVVAAWALLMPAVRR